MREHTTKHIKEAFTAGWASGGEPFPVVFDNQDHTHGPQTLWGRLSLQFSENLPAAIGPDFKRGGGMLFLQIFMPEGTGTKAALVAVDKLESIFSNYKIAIPGLTACWLEFDGGATGPTAAGERTGYQQHNATFRFRVDSRR